MKWDGGSEWDMRDHVIRQAKRRLKVCCARGARPGRSVLCAAQLMMAMMPQRAELQWMMCRQGCSLSRVRSPPGAPGPSVRVDEALLLTLRGCLLMVVVVVCCSRHRHTEGGAVAWRNETKRNETWQSNAQQSNRQSRARQGQEGKQQIESLTERLERDTECRNAAGTGRCSTPRSTNAGCNCRQASNGSGKRGCEQGGGSSGDGGGGREERERRRR